MVIEVMSAPATPDHHHRQPPTPGRLDQIDLLDALEDESIHQGVVDSPLVLPARDQGQSDAPLLACLGDTGEEGVVVLVREEQGDAEIADRHDADGVDLARTQHPPLRVRPGIAKLARGRLDPLAQHRAHAFGAAEYVRDGHLRDVGGFGDIEQCHGLFMAVSYHNFGPVQVSP